MDRELTKENQKELALLIEAHKNEIKTEYFPPKPDTDGQFESIDRGHCHLIINDNVSVHFQEDAKHENDEDGSIICVGVDLNGVKYSVIYPCEYLTVQLKSFLNKEREKAMTGKTFSFRLKELLKK